MPSAADLRKESRRLLGAIEGFIDPKLRQELASRAFELAHRAERIDALVVAHPERLKAEVARCRSKLLEPDLNLAQRRIVSEALADAEAISFSNLSAGR